MRHLTKITLAAALFMCIGGTEIAFADAAPNTESAFAFHASKVKTRRLRRRRVSTIPYLRRNSVIRVRRLSARERRDVFRRLIDIRIN